LVLLLGVGVAASVGQMFLTRAFALGDPARVSVVGLSQVVFSLVIDVTVGGRDVTTMTLLGTLMILAPTAWLMLERTRPAPPRDPGREPVESAATRG
jgi:drug/metabolite transporter (DMT)-like permease